MKKVVFISSTGGHLTELLQLKPMFEKCEYTLITEKTKSNQNLIDQYPGHVHYLAYGTKQHLFKYLFVFAYNILLSFFIFLKVKPDAIVIEELFFNTNITTGIAVAHGRGVLLCAAERCGIPLFEYTPSQVKLAVTGYGKAEKHQVMDMTKRLLKLNGIPRPDDAADALAIAICHARSMTSRLPQTSHVKETI